MSKEILIYSGIYDFTAKEFITKLSEVPADEDIIVRLNSPGGSVFAGWGMIAALKERTGKNILKIDGNASSMAFYLSLFFDEVIALDVTSLMIHRADAYVQSDDDKLMLKSINDALRAKLEKRVDKKTFEEITGTGIKEIFEAEERRNIWISAKEAKKIGLIDKVVRLEPREIKAINAILVAFANFDDTLQGSNVEPEAGKVEESKTTENQIISNNIQKEEKMTFEELKAQHSDVYAKAVQEGVDKERARVSAWNEFSEIDAEAVKKGITEGKEINMNIIAEMSAKALAPKILANAEDEIINDVSTPEISTPVSQEEAEAILAEKAAFLAAGLKMEDK